MCDQNPAPTQRHAARVKPRATASRGRRTHTRRLCARVFAPACPAPNAQRHGAAAHAPGDIRHESRIIRICLVRRASSACISRGSTRRLPPPPVERVLRPRPPVAVVSARDAGAPHRFRCPQAKREHQQRGRSLPARPAFLLRQRRAVVLLQLGQASPPRALALLRGHAMLPGHHCASLKHCALSFVLVPPLPAIGLSRMKLDVKKDTT
jgi:hypothetical protein